jgi:hypothetical protein
MIGLVFIILLTANKITISLPYYTAARGILGLFSCYQQYTFMTSFPPMVNLSRQIKVSGLIRFYLYCDS